MDDAILLQSSELDALFKSKAKEVNISELINQTNQEIKTTLLTQFGLSKIFDSYQKGGDVTTIHNAEQNVFANAEDARRYNKSFDRKDYEGRREIDRNGHVVKDNRLQTQRKQEFQKNKIIKDGYSGKQLPKDGRAHLDHITSAKEIHSDNRARLYMSDDQRNDMAVNKQNLTFIDGKSNQSKGERDLLAWANFKQKYQDLTNMQRFGLKTHLVNREYSKSKKHIEGTIRKSKVEYFVTKTSAASLKQARSQILKQITGLILYEVVDSLMLVIKKVMNKWEKLQSTAARMQYIRTQFYQEFSTRKKRLKDFLKKVWDKSITSGFGAIISTISTTVINSFFTTGKSFGKLLNDSLSSIIGAIKIIVNKNSNVSIKERIKQALKLIGTGLVASIGVILSESIKLALATTPFAPIAGLLGNTISGCLAAVFSVLFIYTIDNFGNICLQIRDSFQLMKVGLMVSSQEIEENYLKTIRYIDDAYQEILLKIDSQYKKINNFHQLISDLERLPLEQFEISQKLASAYNVEEKVILSNLQDIDNYFL